MIKASPSAAKMERLNRIEAGCDAANSETPVNTKQKAVAGDIRPGCDIPTRKSASRNSH
jgi:hypothetical protein